MVHFAFPAVSADALADDARARSRRPLEKQRKRHGQRAKTAELIPYNSRLDAKNDRNVGHYKQGHASNLLLKKVAVTELDKVISLEGCDRRILLA